jgi:hypothetical protein
LCVVSSQTGGLEERERERERTRESEREREQAGNLR